MSFSLVNCVSTLELCQQVTASCSFVLATSQKSRFLPFEDWPQSTLYTKVQFVLHREQTACITVTFFFFSCGAATKRGSWSPHSWGFLDHTQRRTTVGRTPLDEWSARRRDLYLTAHDTHNRQTSMPPVGFEPTISGERPQTYALDRAATGTGYIILYYIILYYIILYYIILYYIILYYCIIIIIE